MPRKLAVLFDGTWNATRDHTHVVRLCDPGNPLPDLALAWLKKAEVAGLGFKADVVVNDQAALANINDSCGEFMSGLYKHFKGGKRHHRAFGSGVNETVDDSVWKRWEALPGYRPPTVAAQRR